jgi:hypothetical protein
MLPRLPFHGCTGVSYEAFRAVVEEILDTEDPMEIDGFESEVDVSEPDTADAEMRIELANEPLPTEEDEELGESGMADESGQPEEDDSDYSLEPTPAAFDDR